MSERVVAELRLRCGGRPCGTYGLVGVEEALGDAEASWAVGAGLARRLIACWNACEGIDTGDLEGGLSMLRLHAELGNRLVLLEALADAAAVLAMTAEQLRLWAEVVPGLAAAIRRKADLLVAQAVALRDLIARAKGGA